jgi:hypothetical protein
MLDARTFPIAMAALAALVAAAPGALAQAGAGMDSYGITAAAFGWEDGHQEQALGATIQLAPTRWLTLGASPTFLRITGLAGSEPRSGLGDLPLFAGITHTFAAPGHPTLGVAGVASLPTGDASQGLGRGQSLLSAQGVLAISPAAALTLRGGASRLLRVGDSVPHGVPTTALFGDAVLLTGARTNLSVGYALELRGEAPSAYEPARAINAALVRTLFGPVALGVSAGHTLHGAGPKWSFALGIGTVFAGLSPVGATSPAARSTGGVTSPANGGLLPIGGARCRLLGGC